jgi:SsrA-binding protein
MAAQKESDDGIEVVARNRQARRNFFIDDTFECGMVLRGSEVKSLRESKVQLAEAYASMDAGEMWIHNLYVAPYSHAQQHSGHDTLRVKKLLLNRRELDRINQRLKTERLALVPMRLYFKDGRAKVEVGIGKGKKLHDKRRDMAEKDAAREADRAMGRAAKGDY